MNKVAVIGGSGMVASRFIDIARQKMDAVSLDEKTLDITDWNAVEKYFSENKFDSVINFAAYTNVDGAEAQKGDESGLVWRLNVGGPENLVKACGKNNIFLVHISTDFVFPGTKSNPGPYSEDSKLPENADGIGWYGWTKNRAEAKIKESGAGCAIVRYGYPFRASEYSQKLDWARNLLRLYSEQKLYPLFDDQIYSILFIDDLVNPLVKILEENYSGIFHIASGDTTSPYEAGKYLLEKYIGGDIKIEKGSMKQFLENTGVTPRPRLGGLKVDQTEKRLGITFKTWKEMIDGFLEQYGK